MTEKERVARQFLEKNLLRDPNAEDMLDDDAHEDPRVVLAEILDVGRDSS